MSEETGSIRNKQNIIFIVLALVVFAVCFGVYFMLDSGNKSVQFVQSRFDLPSDNTNAQELWMVRLEEQNKGLETRLKYMEEVIVSSKKNEEHKSNENSDLRRELSNLKSELKSVRKSNDDGEMVAAIDKGNPYFAPVGDQPNLIPERRAPLKEVIANQPRRKMQHVDMTIPAGTTVRALLVSSVDAPCGALSMSDPQPVKLRIIDNGHLPKGVEAKLKGGIVIAAVYGDLSNERVYMRLERLTQVIENGDFIETQISGFVSGEDGKYGVRGVVVDKSAKMVENAALSGVFSGVNDYFQAMANVSAYSECVEGPNAMGLLKEGGFSGSSNALGMLTDYYIKRAEQIKPVIQVDAGRIVDITFTHGSDLGDINSHEPKAKKIITQKGAL